LSLLEEFSLVFDDLCDVGDFEGCWKMKVLVEMREKLREIEEENDEKLRENSEVEEKNHENLQLFSNFVGDSSIFLMFFQVFRQFLWFFLEFSSFSTKFSSIFMKLP
jgi:hypothetical protein